MTPGAEQLDDRAPVGVAQGSDRVAPQPGSLHLKNGNRNATVKAAADSKSEEGTHEVIRRQLDHPGKPRYDLGDPDRRTELLGLGFRRDPGRRSDRPGRDHQGGLEREPGANLSGEGHRVSARATDGLVGWDAAGAIQRRAHVHSLAGGRGNQVDGAGGIYRTTSWLDLEVDARSRAVVQPVRRGSQKPGRARAVAPSLPSPEGRG